MLVFSDVDDLEICAESVRQDAQIVEWESGDASAESRIRYGVSLAAQFSELADFLDERESRFTVLLLDGLTQQFAKQMDIVANIACQRRLVPCLLPFLKYRATYRSFKIRDVAAMSKRKSERCADI